MIDRADLQRIIVFAQIVIVWNVTADVSVVKNNNWFSAIFCYFRHILYYHFFYFFPSIFYISFFPLFFVFHFFPLFFVCDLELRVKLVTTAFRISRAQNNRHKLLILCEAS